MEKIVLDKYQEILHEKSIDYKIEKLEDLLLINNDTSIKISLVELLTKRRNGEDLNKAKIIALNVLNNTGNKYALLLLSKIERINNNYEEMVDYLERALETKYKKQASQYLGNYYFQKKAYSNAENYYKICYETSKMPSCLMDLAMTSYYSGNLSDSIEWFKELRTFDKFKDIANLYLAKISISKQNYDEALTLLNLITDEKVKKKVSMEYGKIYLEKKEFDKAIYWFSKVENANGRYIKYQLALSYFLKNDYVEAEKRFLELSTSSYSKYSLIYLAKLYKSYNDIENEKQCYYKILESNIDSRSEYGLGRIALKQNDIEEAKKRFENAIRIDDDEYSLFELAHIYYKERQFKESKILLNKIKRHQADSFVLLELGKIELEEKNYQQAIQIFEKALEYEFDEYIILELGKAYYSAGNKEKAIYTIQMLLNTKSEIFALSELMKISMAEEDYLEAKRLCLRILNHNEKEKYNITTIYLYLSKCEDKMGNKEISQEFFDYYLKLNQSTDIEITSKLYLSL